MAIRRLEITRFRNLSHASLELGGGFNYLYGSNGAGKTAVLEAVHVLTRGQSFRGGELASVVQTGAADVIVRVEIESNTGGKRSVGMQRDRGGRLDLRVDGRAGSRQSEVAALLPVEVVLPTASDLVFSSPGIRRRFLDWGVFHVEPSYIDALRRLVRTTRQRNSLLKRVAAGRESVANVAAWNGPLAEAAGRVTAARRAYVDGFESHFNEILEVLEPGLGVTLEFRRGWGPEPLSKVLGDGLAAEVKWGATRAGPHRADLVLSSASGRASATLSRGQGKLVAHAMVLGQVRMLAHATGRQSILLVDDIAAEIDAERAARLVTLIESSGAQVIATSTGHPDTLPGDWRSRNPRVFHVKQGVVSAAR